MCKIIVIINDNDRTEKSLVFVWNHASDEQNHTNVKRKPKLLLTSLITDVIEGYIGSAATN